METKFVPTKEVLPNFFGRNGGGMQEHPKSYVNLKVKD